MSKYKNKKKMDSSSQTVVGDVYKRLKIMQTNQQNYDQKKLELIKNAQKISPDIMENYYLPDDFNLMTLNQENIMPVNLQKVLLPFTNEQIENLIKMPKVAINDVYNFNYRGGNTHAVYLLGKENNKFVLFVLRIDKSCEYKDDFIDFHIKLDACIQGKTWLTLLRLDSIGKKHPNYIVNGKVCVNNSQVEFARCPHLHKCTQECQVISEALDYLTASELDFVDYNNLNLNDKNFFKQCMQKFLEQTNINLKINKKVENNYHYNITNPLFDYETPQIYKPKDCKEF